MSRSAYRTSIPANAREVVEGFHANGQKESASYFVRGRKVGHRTWFENGQLAVEYALRNEARHGFCYSFYESGQILEKEKYRNGYAHGVGKQLAEDGTLLVAWKLSHGTGLNLRCDTKTGKLAMESHFPKAGGLSYIRLWNPDGRTVSRENLVSPGERTWGNPLHGITRAWNKRGRLRRGFPQFWLPDGQVTKTEYLDACKAHSGLIPYRAEDDQPYRRLPREFIAQRKRRRR
jgi:hypothetical protein